MNMIFYLNALFCTPFHARHNQTIMIITAIILIIIACFVHSHRREIQHM